jgi:hypothetical protein
MTQYELNEDLFWDKVAKADCWEWQAFRQPKGYGMVWATYEGKGRMVLAHRAAWYLVNGDIEQSMQLDHTCFNRACVNPGHLRLATSKQNNENRSGAQKNNQTGVRGVSQRGSKWRARVVHNRTFHNVGYFDTKAAAEAAVIAKRLELFTHNSVDMAA